MEIDELKSAWQLLDRRLDQSNRIQLKLLVDGQLGNVRARLRPLYWGQWLQILAGLLMVMLGVSVWTRHLDVVSLLVCGIVVHIYGIAMIACAGLTISMIGGIDYARPVLDIQKQMGRLRAVHVRGGLTIGLVWWLFWIPFAITLFCWLAGVNLFALAPSVVAVSVVIGIVGLLATAAFHHWAKNPRRPRLAQWVSDSLTGTSLRKAQSAIDEIARFERD